MATEFALRKRIRDMERAYDELKWQEQNVNGAHLSATASGWGLNAEEVLCSIAALCLLCLQSHEQGGSEPISSI